MIPFLLNASNFTFVHFDLSILKPKQQSMGYICNLKMCLIFRKTFYGALCDLVLRIRDLDFYFFSQKRRPPVKLLKKKRKEKSIIDNKSDLYYKSGKQFAFILKYVGEDLYKTRMHYGYITVHEISHPGNKRLAFTSNH